VVDWSGERVFKVKWSGDEDHKGAASKKLHVVAR
jgi:hypothetical protein